MPGKQLLERHRLPRFVLWCALLNFFLLGSLVEESALAQDSLDRKEAERVIERDDRQRDLEGLRQQKQRESERLASAQNKLSEIQDQRETLVQQLSKLNSQRSRLGVQRLYERKLGDQLLTSLLAIEMRLAGQQALLQAAQEQSDSNDNAEQPDELLNKLQRLVKLSKQSQQVIQQRHKSGQATDAELLQAERDVVTQEIALLSRRGKLLRRGESESSTKTWQNLVTDLTGQRD